MGHTVSNYARDLINKFKKFIMFAGQGNPTQEIRDGEGGILTAKEFGNDKNGILSSWFTRV